VWCDDGRSVIDIRATANKHRNITECLPGVPALSGGDTMSYLYGIGKLTALKVLSSGRSLELLGREGTNMADVEAEATSFMALCYGSMYMSNLSAMSDIRYAVWSTKMGSRNISKAPKLVFGTHFRSLHSACPPCPLSNHDMEVFTLQHATCSSKSSTVWMDQTR